MVFEESSFRKSSIFRSMEASDLRIKRLITLMQAVRLRLSTRVIFTILAEKDLGAAVSMAEIICLDVFIKKSILKMRMFRKLRFTSLNSKS